MARLATPGHLLRFATLLLSAGWLLSGAALDQTVAQTVALIAKPPATTPLMPFGPQQHTIIPLNLPPLSPGTLELLKLEGEFSDSVTKGGGTAFASWFADDGVTLNNGKPAVRGRTAIADSAKWDPKTYQLSWYAEGAQMGPSGVTGFSWGHYDARSTVDKGQPVTFSGRYITFWKKVDGKWKVALDASADDAPASGDCCSLPTP